MKNKSFWLFELHTNGSIDYTTVYSNRFLDDKVKLESDDMVILADGLVLNKKEVTGESSRFNTLADYYKQCYHDTDLIKKLVGPFVAVVYNKHARAGIAFGNQTGDSSVFYAYNQTHDKLYLSNNFNEVWKRCGRREINERAAHYLLTYGFIVDDSTIVDGIFRLQAGKVLRFSQSECKVEQYHRFKFHNKISITMDEAIEQVDVLFRKAVKRCFDKDLEYGYTQHLADLSAGLDSRMTNVVAKDLGYSDIVNISYSQSDSNEQKISQQIALALENTLYHRSLEDVTFIYEMEKTIQEEFGVAYAHGITGGRQFLRMIDFEKFGLEHTGQIGDVVLSQFFNKIEPFTNFNTKRTSDVLTMRFPIKTEDYSSNEEFAYYTRAFQGALSSHYIRANYTYAVSPFLDPELIEFCSSLPDDIRANHCLYWHWIDKKYPEFGKIASSRIRQYYDIDIKQKASLYIGKISNRLRRALLPAFNKIGVIKQRATSNGMNPFQYWYETKPTLRVFIDDYYQDNSKLVSNNKVLAKECQIMMNSRYAFDKLMTLSLLGTIKEYCTTK